MVGSVAFDVGFGLAVLPSKQLAGKSMTVCTVIARRIRIKSGGSSKLRRRNPLENGNLS